MYDMPGAPGLNGRKEFREGKVYESINQPNKPTAWDGMAYALYKQVGVRGAATVVYREVSAFVALPFIRSFYVRRGVVLYIHKLHFFIVLR